MSSFPTGAIPLTGGIGTTGQADTFPTHYDFLGFGGARAIDTVANMYAIYTERRQWGMTVTIYADPTTSLNRTYILSNAINGGVDNNISNNANWKLYGTSPFLNTGSVCSVGLCMPSAFTVSNSPITCCGNICVTGAGAANQYIRGDGTLAVFPQTGGAGGGLTLYMNGGISQGSIGGVPFYQLSQAASTGAAADFSTSTNGLITSFVTDNGQPNQLAVTAGNWLFDAYFSYSNNSGSASVYAEVYKYDGASLTLLATSKTLALTSGTTVDLYTFAAALPQSALLATDRIAVKIYATNVSGGNTVTMYTQSVNLSSVGTTFPTGINALNGLTVPTQYFATGSTGNDFNICSLNSTHTFNIPSASATVRGLLTCQDWATFNNKLTSFSTCTATTGLQLLPSVVCTGQTVLCVNASTASTTCTGLLSNTDWNTFNNKGTGTMCQFTVTAGAGIATNITTVTNGSTLCICNTGATPPPSCCYIQNQTTQQASSNFNISGTGVIGSCALVNNPYGGNSGQGLTIGQSMVLDAIGPGQNARFFTTSNVVSDSPATGSWVQNTKADASIAYGFNLGTAGDFQLWGIRCGGSLWCINMFSTKDGSFAAGRTQTVSGNYSSATGGCLNTASGNWSSVSGGGTNIASGGYSFIGGGYSNTASNSYSTIVGGMSNQATNAWSFVGGGSTNASCGVASSLVGGWNNLSLGARSALVGGAYNRVQADHGFIGGGICNNVCNATSGCLALGAVVVGGVGNNTSGGTFSTASCTFTVVPTVCNAGQYSFVGGGFQNQALGYGAVIVAGSSNYALGNNSFIGGGVSHYACCNCSAIVGGYNNIACGIYSFVGGGTANSATGNSSAVLGGCCNIANGAYSGAFGCFLTASSPCTFYSNNICSCNLVQAACKLIVNQNSDNGANAQVFGTTTLNNCLTYSTSLNNLSAASALCICSGGGTNTVQTGSTGLLGEIIIGSSSDIALYSCSCCGSITSGIWGDMYKVNTGNVTGCAGLSSFTARTLFACTGNVDWATSFYAQTPQRAIPGCAYAGVITNYAGLFIQNAKGGTIGGQITNSYGIYQEGINDANFLAGSITTCSLATGAVYSCNGKLTNCSGGGGNLICTIYCTQNVGDVCSGSCCFGFCFANPNNCPYYVFTSVQGNTFCSNNSTVGVSWFKQNNCCICLNVNEWTGTTQNVSIAFKIEFTS